MIDYKIAAVALAASFVLIAASIWLRNNRYKNLIEPCQELWNFCDSDWSMIFPPATALSGSFMVKHGFNPWHQHRSIAFWFFLLCPLCKADGLADFQKNLKQLQSANAIALDVEFKLFGRTGEHKELVEREGLMNLRLEDGPGGVKINYARDLVAQLHKEELAKLEDENVKNSALNAVGQFDYWEWRELLHPAAQLELALGRYEFTGETSSERNGKPMRVLNFSLPKEKVDPKFRKYIKTFNNNLEIWIDEKGVPVASSVYEHGSGRVFIVIGFTFNNEFHMEYQMRGGRLIGVRREVREQTEGATMQSYRHYVSRVKSVQ